MTWKIVVLAKLPYYKVNKKVETLVFIYIYIYIYIYKTEASKTPTIFHISTIFKIIKIILFI